MALPENAYPELLSLAVHEFRTPATVLGGYLRMLQKDTQNPLSERQKKMVDEAERACTRLVALVAEMSEIAKLDGGRVPFGQQSFDLFSMVHDVASGVHEAEDRGIRLDTRGEATGAPITGDLIRLQSAFAVIFRAVLREKTMAGTVVVDRRIDRRAAHPAALIVVADEDRVAKAYSEPAGPFDDRRGGLGLGLPLAQRVIASHGGRLWSPVGDSGKNAALVSLPLRE
jgi:signal transduction histidine kinase